MSVRSSPTTDRSAPEPTIGRGGHDRLLDIVRSMAIIRVVLWHTWSWFWLTWIPAMPAMFFTTGALLERSLERRGWLATLKQRFRRLLIPYWVYAAASCAVMVAYGWRPTFWQGMAWLIPLGDPVGNADLPGLWVPLWYIRAYLWFVLGSGVIRFAHRAFGSLAVCVSAVGAVVLWWVSHLGYEIPMAIGDTGAYLPFILAGMHYSSRGAQQRTATLISMAVAAVVAALWSVQRFGPDDMVVNRSYLLTMLVGVAGIATMVAFKDQIISLTSARTRLSSLIDTVNSHALTIYLWQGFGLVAAQRLIEVRVEHPIAIMILSLAVVTVVIVGAVVLFGWVEDWAARRRPPPPRLSRLAGSVPAVALLAVALTIQLPGGAKVEAPLSGRAVVARAGLVEDSLKAGIARADAGGAQTGLTADEIVARWAEENVEVIERIGLTSLEAAIVSPDGTVLWTSWPSGTGTDGGDLIWWSMTKAVTVAWMMQLVEAGVVRPEDHLSEWVPEAPHSNDITLDHLARHTSGIPSELDGSFLDARPDRDIASFYASPQLEFRPGDGFNYSRIGYYLLALALERASGTTWTDAVRQMGDNAGVAVSFDEDLTPFDEVTDPDGHGYRGGLWSSGGLITDMTESTQLLQWIFTKGLSPSSVEAMTRFSPDAAHWYYGLGLLPACPCELVDGVLRAERFGLDSATGLFSVDPTTGAVVMLRPNVWWENDEPVTAFYDLQNALLDNIIG